MLCLISVHLFLLDVFPLVSHGTAGKAGAERCCAISATCVTLFLHGGNSLLCSSMLVAQENICENLDCDFWIFYLMVRKIIMQTWSYLRDQAKLAMSLLPGDPGDLWTETNTVTNPRFLWILLLFKYKNSYLEKGNFSVRGSMAPPGRSLSLMSYHSGCLPFLKLSNFVTWANLYSLLQDPFAAAVSKTFFWGCN